MKKLYQVLKVGSKIDTENCEIRDRGKWYPIKDYELESDKVQKDMKPIRCKVSKVDKISSIGEKEGKISKKVDKKGSKKVGKSVILQNVHTPNQTHKSKKIILGIWKTKTTEEIRNEIEKYEYKVKLLKKVLKGKK